MFRSLTTFIAIFLSLSLFTFSQDLEIKNVTDSTCSLVINKLISVNTLIVIRDSLTPRISPDTKSKYSALAQFAKDNKTNLTAKGNYIVYIGGSTTVPLLIKGLIPGLTYSVDIYSDPQRNPDKYKTFSFFTISPEPQKQAKIEGIANVTTKSMKILFTNGDGKFRMILACEGKECTLPKDGIEYSNPSHEFGKGFDIGESTFIVYLDSNKKTRDFEIKGLKSGTKYYFLTLEGNGKGQSINYNLTLPKKPVLKTTLPGKPVALEAEEITDATFMAKWVIEDGVETYFLEVAEDKDFTKLVPLYNSVDVGTINSLLVEDLPKVEKFYYRIKAVIKSGESDFSNIITVNMKK